jgi:hypothetical protein
VANLRRYYPLSAPREFASFALAKLTLNNMGNCGEILSLGGIDPLIQLLTSNRENAQVETAPLSAFAKRGWFLPGTIDCLIGCLIDWLSDWLVDWLTDWLNDWLIYRVID